MRSEKAAMEASLPVVVVVVRVQVLLVSVKPKKQELQTIVMPVEASQTAQLGSTTVQVWQVPSVKR